MISPDLQDCTYTAEVLRTRAGTEEVATRISEFAIEPRQHYRVEHESGAINLFHAYAEGSREYHRTLREHKGPGGKVETFPRQVRVGGRQRYAYDVVVAQKERHTIVAVPFHGLAEEFFPRVDKHLAGTRTTYERLDITNIVLALGQRGRVEVADDGDASYEIGLTSCQLAYSDEATHSRDLQSVRIAGANLGATSEYQYLVRPVLNQKKHDKKEAEQEGVKVTPLVLGFSLYIEGVKKASATTDRHGNFKVFVGSELRQMIRLFDLLDALERIQNVVFTTSNIPILLAGGIRLEASR